MYGGIEYHGDEIYFLNPEARFPVRFSSGNVTWGSRKKEANSDFPNCSWVRPNSIYDGKWKPWHPRLVLIAADQFVEKDKDG